MDQALHAGHTGQQNPLIAYDPASKQLVLRTDDGTWTWNGAQWTVQHPAHVPPLYQPCMATDSAAGGLILFGGYESAIPAELDVGPDLDMAWRRLGATLASGEPAPERGGDDLRRDPSEPRPGDRTRPCGEYPGETEGDTWTFDGTTWAQREAPNNTTGPVDFSTITYDLRTAR